MADFPDFQSLLDDGIPEPSEIMSKLEDMFLPLAGRYFAPAASNLAAESWQDTSAGTRYDAIPRTSDFLAECFPDASSTYHKTTLPESLEATAVSEAKKIAKGVLADLANRYGDILSRNINGPSYVYQKFRPVAKLMDDERTVRVAAVTSSIEDWNGGGNLYENFGYPIGQAINNHRDMTLAVATAAEALYLIQTKAVKHLDEITDVALEALMDVESSQGETAIILAVVAALSGIAGTAVTSTTLAVEWATAGGVVGFLGTLPLSTDKQLPISASDMDALITDLHGALDTVEDIMAREQSAFKAGLEELFSEKKSLYASSDQPTSSQIVPRVSGAAD